MNPEQAKAALKLALEMIDAGTGDAWVLGMALIALDNFREAKTI